MRLMPGSKKIAVSLEEGGLKSIRVKDMALGWMKPIAPLHFCAMRRAKSPSQRLVSHPHARISRRGTADIAAVAKVECVIFGPG